MSTHSRDRLDRVLSMPRISWVSRDGMPDGGAFQGQVLEAEAAGVELGLDGTRRLPGVQRGQGVFRNIRRKGPEQQFARLGEQGRHRDFVGRDVGARPSPAQGETAGEVGACLAFGQPGRRLVGFRTVQQQFVKGIRSQLHDGGERRRGVVSEPLHAMGFGFAQEPQAQEGVGGGNVGQVSRRQLFALRGLQFDQARFGARHAGQVMVAQIGSPLIDTPAFLVFRKHLISCSMPMDHYRQYRPKPEFPLATVGLATRRWRAGRALGNLVD